MSAPDFSFVDHGSIVIMHALTDAALEWVDAHVEYESWQMWGRNGFAIEPRYVGMLMEGIVADGLALS